MLEYAPQMEYHPDHHSAYQYPNDPRYMPSPGHFEYDEAQYDHEQNPDEKNAWLTEEAQRAMAARRRPITRPITH